MTYYNEPSHVHLGQDHVRFRDSTLGIQQFPDPRESTRQWSRPLAKCHEHTCTYTWQGRVYDNVPVHGAYLVGRAKGEREAIAIWKNYLYSIGIHPEEVEPC